MGVLRFERVTWRAPTGEQVLAPLDWTVNRYEHWVVLGRNGAGKSTVTALASGRRLPTTGIVELLGRRVGETDLREIQAAIPAVTPSLMNDLPLHCSAEELVLTGITGHLAPWWHEYGDEDGSKARAALARVGAKELLSRKVSTCSDGERQRVLLARALVTCPPLLLLDEPFVALDLPSRESLITAIEKMSVAEDAPATVMVTHRLDEIPSTTTHALLLHDGHALASGPIDEVVTSELVSQCFDTSVTVSLTENGRRYAFVN